MGVVCLVALESATTGEHRDETRDTAVFDYVSIKPLITWHNKLLELGLGNRALLVLPKFLFWRDLAIEVACVEDLEYHVEEYENSE